MTPTVTLTLPAAWLKDATSCALYVFSGVAFDIIQFDMVAGQPVLRYPPAALVPAEEKGEQACPSTSMTHSS